MSKLLCITSKQYKPGINKLGDIIGVFSDDWSFTEKEVSDFDIITVSETKSVIENKTPEIKQIYKSTTTEWTDSVPENKHVWKDKDGNYRELVKNPKYKLRYDAGIIKDNISTDNSLSEIITVIKGTK
jgi:hypothetical protein